LHCWGGRGAVYPHFESFKVGREHRIDLQIFTDSWGWVRDIKFHYRLSGEEKFKTIPMKINRAYRYCGKRISNTYSCILPAFSREQKDRHGSVEYYFDFNDYQLIFFLNNYTLRFKDGYCHSYGCEEYIKPYIVPLE
jgi:hypothetical protein